MLRRLLPLVAAAFLLAPILPAQAATTSLNTITNASPGHALGLGTFDGDTYAMADFDKDGRMEVVAFNDNQDLYVLSGTTSRVLAEIRPDYPAGWAVRSINDPVAADIDGDGRPEIVAVDSAAEVCAFHYVSGSSTTSMTFSKMWCHRMSAYAGGGASADSGPAVADVNGDGKMEIFANTETKGLFAYNWDGSLRWSSGESAGNAGPVVADLYGNGQKAVIFFGDAGEVRAKNANTGATLWTFFASSYVWPASIPVAGNAADLDNNGQKEVVFVARDAHDATNFRNDHFVLFVLNANGSLRWKAQPSWGNPMSYTHPVLADVNGDGRKEIVLMDWNTIGHLPGNWEALNPPHVFAYSSTGALLWKDDVWDSWSNDDLAVADVTGDGRLDVLAVGSGNGSDGVWYLNAATGAFEQHVNIAGTVTRGPVAGNLDGSGRLSWAVAVGAGFAMFRTDAACVGPFLGWHGEGNCAGGSGGVPPPPPPPPSGTLTATFAPTNGNEWWIQVKVTASQPLAGVSTRLNGGAWQPLALQSWGEWAASHHAASGTVVQFQARSTSGQTVDSGCWVWTARTPASCTGGTPPPPSGSFAATLSNARGNAWWVETNVAVSGGTLAGVDARVNGGAWQALAATSWGSWAKSLSAPAGSSVQFQARSTAGATSLSGTYAWPPS